MTSTTVGQHERQLQLQSVDIPRIRVLLVYYSAAARHRLEAVLQRYEHMDVFAVDGRASDAIAAVKAHTAQVVVLDHGARDINVKQAVRQIGQILPCSVVIATYPDRDTVEYYCSGHRVGEAVDLESALCQFANFLGFGWGP